MKHFMRAKPERPRGHQPSPPFRASTQPGLAPALPPTVAAVLRLQNTLGNRATSRILQRRAAPAPARGAPSGEEMHGAGGAQTGLPHALKTGAERLSGFALDDVRVHFNSSAPARLGALAYTLGSEIHLAPGQDRHLAHETWHVVQQKQGRVLPTMQARSLAINDDPALEHEADVMSARALSAPSGPLGAPGEPKDARRSAPAGRVVQRRVGFEFETGDAAKGAHVYYYDGANRRFHDKEKFFEAGGGKWKIVVDGGRMEFVTEPLADSAMAGVVAQIQQFITEATAADVNDDLRQTVTVAGAWDHRGGLQRISVAHTALLQNRVQASSFYGNPQISVGVKGAKLDSFMDQLTAEKPFQGVEQALVNWSAQQYPGQAQQKEAAIRQKSLGGLLSNADQAAVAGLFPAVNTIVNNHGGGLTPDEKVELRGFLKYLAMQVQSLERFNEKKQGPNPAASYMKASFPVMPRTDLHSAYSRLSSGVRTAVVAARADFVQAFPFRSASVLGYSLDDLYRSISQPRAHDTQTFNHTQRSVDRMSAQNHLLKNQTDMSIGQLPKDTADKHKLVQELRHVTGITVPFSIFYSHILVPVMAWMKAINAE